MQTALWPEKDRTTGHGSIDHLERYYTPDHVAARCVGLLPWEDIRSVLEPSAGGGAFLRALKPYTERATVLGIDVDANCWAVQNKRAWVGDFMQRPVSLRFDRVVGNPPFSNAEEHVDRALEVAPEVAFLLPMSRFDAVRRMAWWNAAPLRHVWIIAERIWEGSRQIGWFWFDVSYTGDPTFSIISARELPDSAARAPIRIER